MQGGEQGGATEETLGKQEEIKANAATSLRSKAYRFRFKPLVMTLALSPESVCVQVRNSSQLCGELVKASALKALLDTAMSPDRPSSAAGAK